MKNQTSFPLLIKPSSADCNLRCKYCFYLDHINPNNKKTRMSNEVLKSIISKFMQINQPRYVFIWQGGEPTLMGLDFFKKIVEYQKKFGRKGSIVSNILQTNGTLIDDEFASFLRKYNFLLGISLDGPAKIHDFYRKKISGKPSHSEVLRGIKILMKHNVNFNILTLVTDKNVKKPKEVYHYLKKNGFHYHQYIPCVEFDQENQLLPYSITGLEWGNFLIKLFDEWKKKDIKTISIRLFDSILEYLMYGQSNLCQMSDNCCKYLVVEYNGDVYPCDFYVEEGLKLGNILPDNWIDFLNSHEYLKFGKEKAPLDRECQKCSFLELCHGDCKKNRRRGNNGYSRKSSVLCEGWKMFFAHSLPEFKRMLGE